ncbi:MAG: pyrroline-5-carboxylate reductase [Magnetococcales bacterium]|nr:pyrroline-5-carboxylate reductase [Magnetococcales bacterium]
MLTNKIITFIGGGNMTKALLKGLVDSGVSVEKIRICEPDKEKQALLSAQFGVTVGAAGTGKLVKGADVVILAVKPGVIPFALQQISKRLAPKSLILSIAAGVSLKTLSELLPEGQPLVRVMPNTPALIGAGISVICGAQSSAGEGVALARQIMAAVGDVEEIADESLMDGVTAVSGSGPAYVYLIAEALSDGGVHCGLPRPLADKLAVKTLIGAARLIDESGEHPGVLKNQVTSPGGTTIAAMAQLERSAVRGALIDAVIAACDRSKALSNT